MCKRGKKSDIELLLSLHDYHLLIKILNKYDKNHWASIYFLAST
jgi:hypothetical protein